MAEMVHHWKHGWIPLDHAAAATAHPTGAPKYPNANPTGSEYNKTMIDRGVQMHGSDRSKWSLVNLKSAAKMGDQPSKTELTKRLAKAKAKR